MGDALRLDSSTVSHDSRQSQSVISIPRTNEDDITIYNLFLIKHDIF